MVNETVRLVTPHEYQAMFKRNIPAPANIAGICGRVIRGVKEEDFSQLVFQEGRKLAWVTGPVGLRRMIDLSPNEIVLGIGKSRGWLEEKLKGGMSWRLVVFPDGECLRATWDGLLEAIRRHYSCVYPRLAQWQARFSDSSRPVEVPASATTSKVKDDVKHPLHMSPEKYRNSADTVENARLFLWHSIGVNEFFSGTGFSSETGFDEYLRPACPLSALQDHVTIPLEVL